MKDTPLSNCERQFLLKTIEERKRLDGRETYDYRNIKITFGVDYGFCMVDLGKTKVMSQVSCELATPKETRPSEGMLFTTVELSPMASPAFEANKQSELLVKLNRQLERCLQTSKCFDMESLCIISGEKVWRINVDVHVLNHDGNIMDAVSVAAITSLSHFRRPEVSIQGQEFIVHTAEERDLVPLSIYHMPITISFAFFQQGSYLLVDPTNIEEKLMEGLLVIAMNKHRELCFIQSSGGIMLLKKQVTRCSDIASVKVSEITELIQKALENDKRARKEDGKFGFGESLPKEHIAAQKLKEAPVEKMDIHETACEIINKTKIAPDIQGDNSPVVHGAGLGTIGEGGNNSWGLEEDVEEEGEMEEKTADKRTKQKGDVVSDPIVISDSEEEDVMVLTS
ncbi:exosome complex component RRP45 [Engraulis encrasicolus]|uniref:exosome complex component RRP45 n=1 Tax=Engraulis encrasicolus TaxID=184585 RepID=UPI002FD31080